MKTIRIRNKPVDVFLASEIKNSPDPSLRQSATGHIEYLEKYMQENTSNEKWISFTVPYTVIKSIGDGIHSNEVYSDKKHIIVINDDNEKIKKSKHILKAAILHEGLHVSGSKCKYQDLTVEEGVASALQSFYKISRNDPTPEPSKEDCDKIRKDIYEHGKGLSLDRMRKSFDTVYDSLGELGEEVCTTLILDAMNKKGDQLENHKENVSNYKLNLQRTFE